MNIIIKKKNLELTPSLDSYISKRIEGLEKFISILKSNSVTDVIVEVEKTTNHHKKGEIFKTEATINLPGKILAASSEGEDLGKTVTQVRDELKRELCDYKLKKIEMPRREARKSKEKENF